MFLIAILIHQKLNGCNDFAFVKCCNPKEIDRIRQTHVSDLKKEKIVNYFNEAAKDNEFLLIDLKTHDGSFVNRKNLDIRLIKLYYLTILNISFIL